MDIGKAFILVVCDVTTIAAPDHSTILETLSTSYCMMACMLASGMQNVYRE